MLIVRAINKTDFDGLMLLAQLTGGGMTTLKPDPATLSARIDIACASFAQAIPVEQRDYVFVMEDVDTGRLAGVCAIKGAVGLDKPFYNYRLGTLVHASAELGILSKMQTLYLSNDLTGMAELCSLFLHPDFRTGSNGKLLSKSRFMFIAQFPDLFPEKVIAEMRGFQRADGTSAFWDSLGAHFFKMDFNRADDLSSLGKKSFIAEMMPRHPLYVDCLPREAQDVIGIVHEATAPARAMLEQEGLHYEGYVDIFDAGPVLQCRVSELRAVRESRLITVDGAGQETGCALERDGTFLVSNTGCRDFRVIATNASFRDANMRLTSEEQDSLACSAGDRVRILPITPKNGESGQREQGKREPGKRESHA